MSNEEILDVEFKDSVPEGEEGIESLNEDSINDKTEQESIEEKIKEKVDTIGYAYVYDGEILDESKLTLNSKIYCIFNQRTGLPFIYNGIVVRYGGIIEASSALNTLKMFTGNEDLKILDYEELKGKSIL